MDQGQHEGRKRSRMISAQDIYPRRGTFPLHSMRKMSGDYSKTALECYDWLLPLVSSVTLPILAKLSKEFQSEYS